jgi:hypothetical protein
MWGLLSMNAGSIIMVQEAIQLPQCFPSKTDLFSALEEASEVGV